MFWSELLGHNWGMIAQPLVDITLPWVYGRWNARSYNHRKLDLEEDQAGLHQTVRILMLLPGSGEDPVRCELLPIALDGGTSYEALSYSWGGHLALLRVIHVDGRSFIVTDSWFRALRALRPQSGSPRTLWIGQICINQFDNEEKSHQVQMMGKIYQNAAYVIIWLVGMCRGLDPVTAAQLHVIARADR
ncbi:heterokaryon incompatibility protein-domain-containing protein [Xylariales sp. PMI_506]|nr:heterokaryon incompatibility protein-domain-containing protein [Xylariales sp. PMI_506]